MALAANFIFDLVKLRAKWNFIVTWCNIQCLWFSFGFFFHLYFAPIINNIEVQMMASTRDLPSTWSLLNCFDWLHIYTKSLYVYTVFDKIRIKISNTKCKLQFKLKTHTLTHAITACNRSLWFIIIIIRFLLANIPPIIQCITEISKSNWNDWKVHFTCNKTIKWKNPLTKPSQVHLANFNERWMKRIDQIKKTKWWLLRQACSSCWMFHTASALIHSNFLIWNCFLHEMLGTNQMGCTHM